MHLLIHVCVLLRVLVLEYTSTHSPDSQGEPSLHPELILMLARVRVLVLTDVLVLLLVPVLIRVLVLMGSSARSPDCQGDS